MTQKLCFFSNTENFYPDLKLLLITPIILGVYSIPVNITDTGIAVSSHARLEETRILFPSE